MNFIVWKTQFQQSRQFKDYLLGKDRNGHNKKLIKQEKSVLRNSYLNSCVDINQALET